jgi:hypothetical protein
VEPVVDALADVRRQRNPSLVADVVVTVMAAPSGVMLDLNAGQIGRLALAGCGVVVNTYE